MVMIQDCSESDKMIEQTDLHVDESSRLAQTTWYMYVGGVIVPAMDTNSTLGIALHEGSTGELHRGVDLCQESKTITCN